MAGSFTGGLNAAAAPVATPPSVVPGATVEIKPRWQAAWVMKPELAVESMTVAVTGQDLGQLTLIYRYGAARSPHETTTPIPDRAPLEVADWWVRVRIAVGAQMKTIWTGRISSDARDIHGRKLVASGVQRLVAYEPLKVLQKIHVTRSLWKKSVFPAPEVLANLGWTPSFNEQSENGLLFGNRSKAVADDIKSYLFGGPSVWTRLQMAEYLLERFATNRTNGEPIWTIGGQMQLLDSITAPVSINSGDTLATLLRKIIPLKMGIDFLIQANDTGFEVFVYVLTAADNSFNGVTIPKNPNVVPLDLSTIGDVVNNRIIKTNDQRYVGIRVIGARIVVLCTLHGRKAPDVPFDGFGPIPTFVPKWNTTLEDEYKSGTGTATDSADDHDAARKQDKFRAVYRQFGAPSDWDHQAGKAAPVIDLNGNVDLNKIADFQNVIRQTLTWMPLREGFSYVVGKGIDTGNLAGHEADFLPPACWVFDEEKERYVPAEEAGITVAASQTDIGLRLSASPNHLLGLNNFIVDPVTNTHATNKDPVFDFERFVATVAFESDQRLEVGSGDLSGDFPNDGVITVDASDAEMWYMAPNTVLGVDTAGNLIKSTGLGPKLLRNDANLMALRMAGAIARYQNERARAEITFKGTKAFSALLGQIVRVLEPGTATVTIEAPITAVDYTFGDNPTTTVRTGFAR